MTRPHKVALIALASLAGVGAIAAQTSDRARIQRAVPAGSVRAAAGPAKNFTGRAMVRPLVDPVAPGRTSVGEVTFAAGARSNWHTHPAGQTLYVTSGCGWTQQEGQPAIRLCKGDTLYTPPGAKHWHGGSPASAMTNIAITETVDGRNVDWLEPVTDAQYRAATSPRR